MTTEIVLTIIARDRPGLVRTLADVVTNASGNWIDSSMARLGGEFAGILLVSAPDDKIAGLESALAALKDQGIDVTIRRDAPLPPAKGRRARLEMTGLDHPGIIKEVSGALASRGVSIEELHTKVFSGSMSGETMFLAEALIVLPEGMAPGDMTRGLEQLAQDLMVDIDLSDAEPL